MSRAIQGSPIRGWRQSGSDEGAGSRGNGGDASNTRQGDEAERARLTCRIRRMSDSEVEACGWPDALCLHYVVRKCLMQRPTRTRTLRRGWRQVGGRRARTSAVRARSCVGPGWRTLRLAEGTMCFRPVVESEVWRPMQETRGYEHSCGDGHGN